MIKDLESKRFLEANCDHLIFVDNPMGRFIHTGL